MTSSGTFTFNPRAGELAIEIFERCGIRAAEVTVDHMLSVKLSMNLWLQSKSNLGVNLFAVDQQTINLNQAVATYSVPASTIDVLPDSIVLRTYTMSAATDVTPDFATTISDATITATQADHGYVANGWINIIVPVSVGGLILYGLYQVTSVPNSSTYTFEAAGNAASNDSGGAVPAFATTANSTTVTVTLADHGYLAGATFVVNVATDVGGITLTGSYTIATVPTADTFTITAEQTAGSTDTASENDGDTQISGQDVAAGPQDLILAPISRGDYAAQPNKEQQGRPTVYWFNRQLAPEITFWQTPDQNGPYVCLYWRTHQIEDASPTGTETVAIPPRFLEAFASGVAGNFAIKWKPDLAPALLQYANQMWAEAAREDSERVTTSLIPQLAGYYR